MLWFHLATRCEQGNNPNRVEDKNFLTNISYTLVSWLLYRITGEISLQVSYKQYSWLKALHVPLFLYFCVCHANPVAHIANTILF